ncbi:zinc-finger homeodomain protein 1-like protein [Tanacetum coccineum]
MEFDEHEEQEDMSSIHHQPVRKLTGGGGYRYRECLKNHAVTIGGHAVDGCGEFMAAGDDGTLDALKCAACTCHRNFHRKESISTFSHAAADSLSRQQQQYLLPPPPGYYHRPSGYLNMTSAPTSFRPLPLALPSASRDDLDEISNPSSSGGGGNGNGNGGSGKRFRTKFTPDQKDRMLAFAETLGWRIQKQDEGAVQEFCTETGVKRHVLKVWMHNNKHTIGKKP